MIYLKLINNRMETVWIYQSFQYFYLPFKYAENIINTMQISLDFDQKQSISHDGNINGRAFQFLISSRCSFLISSRPIYCRQSLVGLESISMVENLFHFPQDMEGLFRNFNLK